MSNPDPSGSGPRMRPAPTLHIRHEELPSGWPSDAGRWRRHPDATEHVSNRAVEFGPGDDGIAHIPTELESGLGGATEVDTGPDTGSGILLRPGLEELLVSREEIAQDLGRCRQAGGMPRRVIRVRVGWQDGAELGVKLVGPRRPVEELAVPTGDGAIVAGDADQRVGPR